MNSQQEQEIEQLKIELARIRAENRKLHRTIEMQRQIINDLNRWNDEGGYTR